MTTKWPTITMSSQEYEDMKERKRILDQVLSMPEVKALISKVNALGEEIKELKEKCKQLKESEL